MGEIYPDNSERLLVPEWQNERNCDYNESQEPKAGKDFQRGQSFPVPHLWADTAYDYDDRQKSLLPSTC